MPISDALKRDAWSSESDLVLALLEITSPDLSAPIRVVNNNEAITSNGDVFTAMSFALELPDDLDDAPGRARVTIDNVSREISEAVRLAAAPPSAVIRVVRPATPDVIEVEYSGLILQNVEWDALEVVGDLAFEDLLREPFPAFTFNPANYPGLVTR